MKTKGSHNCWTLKKSWLCSVIFEKLKGQSMMSQKKFKSGKYTFKKRDRSNFQFYYIFLWMTVSRFVVSKRILHHYSNDNHTYKWKNDVWLKAYRLQKKYDTYKIYMRFEKNIKQIKMYLPQKEVSSSYLKALPESGTITCGIFFP